jgi:hypothetical protein
VIQYTRQTPTCFGIEMPLQGVITTKVHKTYLLIYLLFTYFLSFFLTYFLSYLLTFLLTAWSRVLLENLTVPKPVKKFPTFYGTWKFITAFTNARHLSLSWAITIQSTPRHQTSWRSILILSSHLKPVSPKWQSMQANLLICVLEGIEANMPEHIFADWLEQLCCNNFLMMAPHCRNTWQLMYALCIVSLSAFFR